MNKSLYRLLIPLVLLAIAGTATFAQLFEEKFTSSTLSLSITGLAALGFTLYTYLQSQESNGTKDWDRVRVMERRMMELYEQMRYDLRERTARPDFDRAELEKLKEEIQILAKKGIDLNEQERKKFVELILTDARKTFTEQSLQTLRDEIKRVDKSNQKIDGIDSASRSSRERLLREIDSLSKRANINLIFGTITTLVGLVILGYVVFTYGGSQTDWVSILAHFIPRVSLVLFIELFAFFFLRLYRNSLLDIKYFQNELTNVEARFSAATVAVALEDKEMLTVILKSLAETERNGILLSGQSTVEIEKAKLEGDALCKVLDRVRDITKAK